MGLLTKDISSNGNNGMRRGDLLLMYLEGADLLLDAAIEGLGERNLQTQTTHDLPTGRDIY